MMAIVIIFAILNQYMLAIVVGYIIAVSALLGVSVTISKPKRSPISKKNELSSVKKETTILEVAEV
jgi:hypothetical protein